METNSNGPGNGQAITPLADGGVAGVLALSPAEIAAWRNHHLQRAQWHLDCSRHHRRAARRFDPPDICRAIEFVEQHLTEALNVTMVARHVGMSPSPFSRRWNQVTGLSLTEYLARHRVERAKTLLLETDLKIIDLSLAAGFQSEAAFYRWFGKLTGKSPKEYRRG